MRSSVPSTSASEVEVTNVGSFGLWILLQEKEYFLPYEQYPWFKEARIADVLNVTLAHEDHLHWPALGVDLCVESLDHPEDFPLIYRDRPAASKRRAK
jgi:hypothetical protein